MADVPLRPLRRALAPAHRTAEPTTLFRASEAAWAKEMNGIGEATFGLKMPGWVTDGPQLFRTQTGRLRKPQVWNVDDSGNKLLLRDRYGS